MVLQWSAVLEEEYRALVSERNGMVWDESYAYEFK